MRPIRVHFLDCGIAFAQGMALFSLNSAYLMTVYPQNSSIERVDSAVCQSP